MSGSSKRARVGEASSSRVRSRSDISEEPLQSQPGNPNIRLKTFLHPRWVDLGDLANVLPTLQFMFSAIGWDSFILNHQVYYPDLVYEFYESLYVEDEKMFSTVQGRKIRVSDRVLGGALDISYRDQPVEMIWYNNMEIS